MNEDQDSLSEQIDTMLCTFEMVMCGFSYLFDTTALGDELSGEHYKSIWENWLKLHQLIKLREQEHYFLWNMAIHGEENPSLD